MNFPFDSKPEEGERARDNKKRAQETYSSLVLVSSNGHLASFRFSDHEKGTYLFYIVCTVHIEIVNFMQQDPQVIGLQIKVHCWH